MAGQRGEEVVRPQGPQRRAAGQVVVEVGDGEAAVATVGDVSPDVVVMDLELPGMDGIATTERIVAALPDVKVLFLSSFDDRSRVIQAVGAGASGYLLKTVGASEVADAVRQVADGELVFPPHLAEVLLGGLRGRGKEPDPPATGPSSSLFAPLERGNYPGLVFTPGYGEIGEFEGHWSSIHRLVEEGYVVLAVSPQGTGGSDVDPDPEYCGGDGSEWWRQPQEGGLVETHECAGHHSLPFENDPTGFALTGVMATALGEEEHHAALDEAYASFRPAWVFATIDAAHWLVSNDNPWHTEVKRSRIGAFGHSAGADAATIAAAADPLVNAAVAFDSGGDVAPYAVDGGATLFLGSPHVAPGYDPTPGRSRPIDNAFAYRDAGTPTGVVLIDDSVHLDFLYIAWPFSARDSNQPYTRSVAHHDALAWFDLHLKGDRTAPARLTAEVFDGSADRSSIGQGTYDPVTMRNVPYTVGGRPVSDFTGRRAPNSFWLP